MGEYTGVPHAIAKRISAPLKWNYIASAYPGLDGADYNNNGWRYLLYSSGSLVFMMSIARITIIRLHETPKYLLGEGKDALLVANFHSMAKKYNRSCSLTLEQLSACGVIESAHGKTRFSISELMVHLRGLFTTRKLAASMLCMWLSWTLIGLAYPLYYVFLSTYLKTRGAEFGNVSTYDTWRNFTLVNISGIPVCSSAKSTGKSPGNLQ